MNPRQSSEAEIFDHAAELSGAARAAYLAQVCGGNARLRQRVETLLHSHEHAGAAFLNQPAGASAQTPFATTNTISVSEQPGDKIGRYKLRERIGEGGCGVVYEAEQEEPVRRLVALKVIRLGMDTRQVVARFEAERQALALMDHPHIAKVLDAGATEAGRPYFVMELVRGIKITDYCDQNNLPTEERLRLFIQVCSAIQHAHQKGIIHRDIKPSNILVTLHDGVPVPKVIDFGIAKATADLKLTDKTIFTAIQQFLGTPAYMSPEQAKMSEPDIDTRSDIYSLGVLLYELVAGSPPFDPVALHQAGFDAMRKTIREVEPPRPSTRLSTLADGDLATVAIRRRADATRLVSSLRGDLDWIIMKALEKDRARRYENVTGFSEDVQRHLAHEAVTARPPTAFYRFGKLVRRNQLLFAAISAVAVVLLMGLMVSTWLFFRELKARGQARQRQLLAETQLVRLTDHAAGWSQRAWSLAGEAAKIQSDAGAGDVRDQAAATLGGLDARRIQQFTNFGASSVLFDHDGKRLLMGSLGDSTRLWDGTTNEPAGVQNSEASPVAFAAGMPAELRYDTNRHCFKLSSLPKAEILREWSLPEQIVTRMKAGATPTAPAITPDGTVIVTAMELSDGKDVLAVLRLDSTTMLDESTNSISALAVSSDGRLAVAESGGQLKVWSLESGRQIATFTTGRNQILSLALKSVARTTAGRLPGGAENSRWLLAAGDSGGDVTIYNVQSNEILTRCRGGHYQVYAVAFSPDGTTLASGGRGPVKLWDIATGKLLLDIPTGDYITGLDFSPDGQRLAAGTEGITSPKNVSVWGLGNGRGIQSLRGLAGQISKVCFSADGRRVAALSHQWEVGVWEVASGQLLRVIEAPEGQFADNAAIALDATGERLAYSAGNKARLWKVGTGTELNAWDLPEGLVEFMAFTDQSLLLFRVDDWNEASRVCRIRDLLNQGPGKPVAEIPDFNRGVFAAAVSPDGRCFVVEGLGGTGNARRRMVKAYDGHTGKELWKRSSTKTTAWGMLVPDDASRFVVANTADSPQGELVELSSGTMIRQLASLPSAINSDASVYAVNGLVHDRGCSLFLESGGAPLVTLSIDSAALSVDHFDRSGNRLAWGNTDGTVTLCDLHEINKRLASAGLQWRERGSE